MGANNLTGITNPGSPSDDSQYSTEATNDAHSIALPHQSISAATLQRLC